MSAPDLGPPARPDLGPEQQQEHPDAGLARQVEAALQWWLAQPHGRGLLGAPTSALTGGGAIAALELAFSHMHANRPALLLPSATLAIRAALDALNIQSGDEVLLPALDWTASRDAVHSLGAVSVPVAVDPDTLTISATRAAQAQTPKTAAVICCHLHGVAADVPALRHALPGLPIIEDCAAALGSTLDGRPVGTHGDYAAFSLGPGKTIDGGEGGVLIAADDELALRAIRHAAPPLRQLLAGADPATSNHGLNIRPHVLGAILGLHQLSQWNLLHAQQNHRLTAGRIRDAATVLGLGTRRENAQHNVPAVLHSTRLTSAETSAQVLAARGTSLHAETEALRRTVRLVPAATPHSEI